ncbi:double-strand break repair helicase AddA [Thalassobius vesicularis]|uniref:DNA 3'-5' helicase n=1 Tax=Thalassobius vesicularis TaxID=1294297 RepID=A0A4S3MDC8_9RHOB|nr:double-strand break repair helicase AddA [Thalassobius vesicularis]THD76833.1 double-strand break repair helicase AddA [Thalassobius vesicularis]
MRDDATEAQVQAARPDWSTWLSANAGSGKTRVLTDRVARLLLRKVQPQHILCLTYTKAAASEMQNRLFKRLGEWAMLRDDDLRHQLVDLGVEGDVTSEELRNARTLFARAIETPGGLKIQTIHSFCASLLRRFPLEAKVSPQFTEMEDRAAALLQEEVLREIAEGPQRHKLEAVAAYVTSNDFAGLTRDLVGRRAEFQPPMTLPACLERLGVPEDYTEAALLAEVFLGGEVELLAEILPVLNAGTTNDVKAATQLATVTGPGLDAMQTLEGVFLNKSGQKAFQAKIGSFPTKDTRPLLGTKLDQLEALMRRVEDARPRRLALAAARKTAVLHDFAGLFLPTYERKKQERGWLDFDDLILRARDLLTDPTVAAWVLYRLDGGIDHILVDEAQDTSPAQWRVIELLAQEFTSGEGARGGAERTIFVVGDKKQSIYSFQGADPREFDRMQAEFAARLDGTDRPLAQKELKYSFRSSQAVLGLVDETFRNHADSGFPDTGQHIAFKGQMPGRVDIWPVIAKVKDDTEEEWDDPVDRLSEKHHNVRLAEHIADTIERLIRDRHPIPEEIGHSGTYRMRAVTPGDFLVLVRKRSGLFPEIIRACKARNLDIAGADRMKVGAELAVKDLAALLSFLSTPEDSFSLAVALKSPLFGWSEKQLFQLAHSRKEPFLWEAMRKRAAEYPAEMAVLDDLRGQTDFLRPYDLIERILTLHDGRRKLLARLGVEAEDGINAFLAQALAYERNAIPSLKGFLEWMVTDDLEIKRQMDAAQDQIRVMTVHGAKGLEAPIVILPDALNRPSPNRGDVQVVDGAPYWKPPSSDLPPLLDAARAEDAAREQAESDRLLYVAMTRAEKWLMLAGAGDWKEGDGSWYDKVRQAALRLGAGALPTPAGEGLGLSVGDWTPPVSEPEGQAAQTETILPGYFTEPATQPEKTTGTLSPSDLGGAKALAGEAGLDEEAAMERGSWLHALLEHLPGTDPDDWPTVAQVVCDGSPQTEELLSEAAGVLGNPALGFLFGPDSLPEVPVTADLPGLGRRMHGVIDRLVLTSDRVLIVDYKTNAVVPNRPENVPDGLLRQLGAYAVALAQIYPDRRIETAILWTRTAELMLLPTELTTAALEQVTLP